MTLITDALGVSATYEQSLSGATQKLEATKSRDQIKAIVESLVASTREMRETNKALEDRLADLENRDRQSAAEPRRHPGGRA